MYLENEMIGMENETPICHTGIPAESSSNCFLNGVIEVDVRPFYRPSRERNLRPYLQVNVTSAGKLLSQSTLGQWLSILSEKWLTHDEEPTQRGTRAFLFSH